MRYDLHICFLFQNRTKSCQRFCSNVDNFESLLLLLISRFETIAAIFPENNPAKTKVLLLATEFEKVQKFKF